MTLGFTGRHHSEASRAKMSAARKGRPFTEEHKRRISKALKRSAPWKGKQMPLELRKRLSDSHRGPKHWNWQGGISKYPYGSDFQALTKRFIRERDGNTCQSCGRTQRGRGLAFQIHHIDFNKKNNNLENLVLLCLECHLTKHREHRKERAHEENYGPSQGGKRHACGHVREHQEVHMPGGN